MRYWRMNPHVAGKRDVINIDGFTDEDFPLAHVSQVTLQFNLTLLRREKAERQLQMGTLWRPVTGRPACGKNQTDHNRKTA